MPTKVKELLALVELMDGFKFGSVAAIDNFIPHRNPELSQCRAKPALMFRLAR